MAIEQLETAPALTGNETANDIKRDYSRDTSRAFTSYLNRDHEIIRALLQKVSTTSGGALGGVGRIVEGLDFTAGRSYGAPGAQGLFLYVPSATYWMAGEAVEVDDLPGFVSLPIPANMGAPGKFVYLSPADGGGVEILAENCLTPVDGKPPANAPDNLPCLGLIVTDDESVVSIDPLYTDEIMAPNKLLILLRVLSARVDALGAGGGGGDGGGGGGPVTNGVTEERVNELLAALRAELLETIATGQTRPMQTDNDHFASLLLAHHAALSRLAPEVTDLAEVAMVNVGFAGHSRSGDYDDPGVNGTTNHLLWTTMHVSTVDRTLIPGQNGS